MFLAEILWTFSIYLEAVAIMPQLILIQRYGNVENLTANYVFCLGAYRGLCTCDYLAISQLCSRMWRIDIFNWIDRYFTGKIAFLLMLLCDGCEFRRRVCGEQDALDNMAFRPCPNRFICGLLLLLHYVQVEGSPDAASLITHST